MWLTVVVMRAATAERTSQEKRQQKNLGEGMTGGHLVSDIGQLIRYAKTVSAMAVSRQRQKYITSFQFLSRQNFGLKFKI